MGILPLHPLDLAHAKAAIESADPELRFLEELDVHSETQAQLFNAGHRRMDMFSRIDSTETNVRAMLQKMGLDAPCGQGGDLAGDPSLGKGLNEIRGRVQAEGGGEGSEPSLDDHHLSAVGIARGLGASARRA